MTTFLKRLAAAACSAALIVGMTGCPSPSESTPPPAQATLKCSACGMEAKSGEFCASCKRCAKCDTCPRGGTGTVTYKCDCGKTQTVAASAPVPHC